MAPCAVCKFLRRKCTQECVFAPHFPPADREKFITVHKVFGASNVGKILNELHPDQRQDAVNSLLYEAEAHIRDPVRGCVGDISFLQEYLKKVQQDLVTAKAELAGYEGAAAAMIPPTYLPPPPLGNNPPPNFMMSMQGGMLPNYGVIPQGEPNFPQQHQPQDEQLQFVDSNGLVTATSFNPMVIPPMRYDAPPPSNNPPPNFMMPRGGPLIIREPNLSQQHQPQDEQLQFVASDGQRRAAMVLGRGGHQGMFNGYGVGNSGSVTATDFSQMDLSGHGAGGSLSGPSSHVLGNFGDAYQMGQETEHHINQNQLQTQPPLQDGQEQTEEGQFLMQTELAGYESAAMIPPPLGNNPPPNFMMSMKGMPPGVIPHGEPLIFPQQHQPQDEQLQFDASDGQRRAAMVLDRGGHQGMFNGYGVGNSGSVTAKGFSQMDHGAGGSLSGPSSHTLGNFGDIYQMGQETEHHINHNQFQTQHMLQPPLQEGQEQTEEGQFLMQPMGQENLHG